MNQVFDFKKSTQAVNFFARRSNGFINKMKALKLLWLADRLHLRMYGRTVTNDIYFAMQLGPVASGARNLMEDWDKESKAYSYFHQFLSTQESNRKNVVSLNKVDDRVFSATDITALEQVLDAFGNKSPFDLSKLSHLYPEWKRFEQDLAGEDGKGKRFLMIWDDFFVDPAEKDCPLFSMDPELLSESKEVFYESSIF